MRNSTSIATKPDGVCRTHCACDDRYANRHLEKGAARCSEQSAEIGRPE